MTEAPVGIRDRLVDEFTSLLSDAQDTLKRANAETGARASELRSQAESKLLRGKLRLQELQGEATQRTLVAARATNEYVHENPWPMLGVAALIGFLIGVAIDRR